MSGHHSAGYLERLRIASSQAKTRACEPLARLALSSTACHLIRADLAKWIQHAGLSKAEPEDEMSAVAALIAAYPEYRTLIYYRLARAQPWIRALFPLLKRIWRPHPILRFFPDSLGPGCFILHGYATGVAARSIGANFVVGQHVVIGYKAPGELPTIGDNVTVYVGAIVIGNVSIGDGAVVGAGAVVVRDVPPGATVVGEAAHEIGERRGPR